MDALKEIEITKISRVYSYNSYVIKQPVGTINYENEKQKYREILNSIYEY